MMGLFQGLHCLFHGHDYRPVKRWWICGYRGPVEMAPPDGAQVCCRCGKTAVV